MRKCRSIPVATASTFILIVGLAASPTRTVYAADDCIAKPNSPAPQGQHWYYRIDHANKRQCWRLGPEGLPVQRSASSPEQKSASSPEISEQPALPTHSREAATTGAAVSDSQPAPDTNVTNPVAPVRWLGAQNFPDLPPVLQPVPQTAVTPESRIASALKDIPPSSNVATASVMDDSRPATGRNEETQQSTTVRRAVSPASAPASSDIDHTFAFLIIMFAMLAVAGPTLHYAERRRARAERTHQPPRWAHVVAPNASTPRIHAPLPNAPTPRIHAPLPRDQARLPAPIPPIPPDRTEKLAQALRQLVDRLQIPSSPEPSAATGPVNRADREMRRSAR